MSKTMVTNEHASHEPKKTGCCGGAPAKDQKAQPDQKRSANTCGDHKHEHADQTGGDSDCCGDGKASEVLPARLNPGE